MKKSLYQNKKDPLEGLPEDFRAACATLLQESNIGKQQGMRYKYHLGKMVLWADKLQESYPKNMRIVDKLMEHQRIKDVRRMAARVRKLVTMFTEAEMEELIKITPEGYCLGWGHFNFIFVNYINKQEALYYLNYAKKYKISSDKLNKIIKIENDRKDDPQGKTLIKTTDKLETSIEKYISFLNKQDNLLDKVASSVLAEWKAGLSSTERRKIIDQLDRHLVSCITLKSRLQ